MARADERKDGDARGWRQRAVSKSLSAARTRAEQRVQRLLDAAFELIDEKGTAEFTIQEVVDRSGQSLRGFYQYFEGKDELLFALLEESIEEAITDLGEGADRPFLALPPATVFEADFDSIDIPKVDEVFIMTADGMLIQHFSYKDTSMVDEDILASMLTVVQNFIQDSFGGSGGLKKLELGNFTILIEKGEYLSVVVISPEKDVEPLMKPISMMVMHMEQMNTEVLKDWNGDQGAFTGMEDAVAKLVEGKY